MTEKNKFILSIFGTVVIFIYLSCNLCLSVCLSDHNSGTSGPILNLVGRLKSRKVAKIVINDKGRVDGETAYVTMTPLVHVLGSQAGL